MDIDSNDPNRIFPVEGQGFYVFKCSDGQWLFGRPKQGVLFWEKTELCDLLNLGISVDNLEGLVVDQVYRSSSEAIFLAPG